MQKITPFLWFDDNAEQAVKFYLSVFKKGKITGIAHYPKSSENAVGRKKGSVMTIAFELMGQEYVALNGGPHFKFTEAVSFFVNCKTQKEIDYYWEKLSAGGEKSQCGWLKDKFGFSWQIVPENILELIGGKDPKKNERVLHEVWKMGKIDIKRLEKARKSVSA
jgi:predicted 3-demethylubiquinone-9 3-methyltransferase (glyoxalase superfamily)